MSAPGPLIGPRIGPGAVAAAVVLTAFSGATLVVAPVIVGALVTGYGYSVPQAGLLIAIELGAMSLATLPALWWVSRLDWHRVLYAALAVLVAGNAACAYAHSFAMLGALRTVTGLAGGSVMVICLALIARTRETERNFGWWTVGQLLVGAAGLAILPRVLPSSGLSGYFVALSIVYAACLLLVPRMPRGTGLASGDAVLASAGSGRPGDLMALAGVLVFYVALSAVWTYIERIGAAAGIAPTTIGDDLTFASVCGIAGCLAATALGARLGQVRPLGLGYALLAGSTAALVGTVAATRYAAAAAVFKFSWTFTLPYILAVVAARDTNGRLIALANLMIGSGLALGPAMVAWLMGPTPSYSTALALGIVGAIASLLLMLIAQRARR